MNQLLKQLTSFFLLTLLCISCNKQESIQHKLLCAQQMMDSNPQETLAMLDSITSTEKLTKNERMYYTVLVVEAKRKNNLSVIDESRIFDAVVYFESREDKRQAAWANYYAASVSYFNKDFKSAEQYYLRSAMLSEQYNDNLAIAKSYHGLGVLSYEINKFSEAISYFNLAIQNYDKISNTDLIYLKVMTYIGRSYEATGEYSIAEEYFKQTFMKAEELKNQEYIGYSYLNLGLVNFKKKSYSNAFSFLHNALPLMQTETDTIKVYTNLARTHSAVQQIDSAAIYMQLVENGIADISDNHTLEFAYVTLEDFYESEGSAAKALAYAKKLRSVRELINDTRLQNLLSREEVKKEIAVAYEQKAAKEKTTTMLIVFITSIIVVAVTAVVIIYRAKKMIWKRYEMEMDLDLHMWHKITDFIYNPYFIDYPKAIKLSAAEIIASFASSIKLKKDVVNDVNSSQKLEFYVINYVNEFIDSFYQEARKQLIKIGKKIILEMSNGEQMLSLLSDKDILTIMLIRQQLPMQVTATLAGDVVDLSTRIPSLSLHLSKKIPQCDVEALLYPHLHEK